MAGEMEWGSDVVVELMKQYDIEYAPTNLGATFRGLLDSLINYGDNKTPEIIECLHEEIAVLIAAGYGKLTGKPAAALVHNVVGTMHATMAIYDAYVGKTPMIVLSDTGPMSMDGRRPIGRRLESRRSSNHSKSRTETLLPSGNHFFVVHVVRNLTVER